MKKIIFAFGLILGVGIAHADSNLQSLTADTTAQANDLLYKANTPGFTSRSITIKNMLSQVATSSVAVGAVGLSQLSATGTQSSSTFLRGDNTFAVPPSSGGSSTLAISSNNVIVSSPTSNINFMPPFIVSLQGSTSAQVTLNSSSATLLGQIIPLGTNTSGIYLSSVTGSGSITITGTNNVASAAPIFTVNPTSVAVLAAGLIPNSEIDGSSVTKGGVLVAGSNITLTPGAGITTIAASGSGGGGVTVPSTFTWTLPQGIIVSTVAFSSPYAVKSIFLNAGSGLCTVNNGCVVPAQYQTATSSVNYVAATFQAGTTQYWQTNFTLPRNYVTASTFTANFIFTTTMSVVTSNWKIDLMSVANTGAIDTAWGTAVTVSTGSTITGALNISQDSGAITAAGSPDINKELYVRVYRNGDVTGDVRFLGVRIYYLYNKLSEN